jgi:hypothetical protein
MKIPQVNILFCAFILFFCCASDPGWASVYQATQDSYINGGSVNSQYGGQDSLDVDNRGDSASDLAYAKKAYIEFDISGHEQQVHQAELQLHVLPGLGDPNNRLWTFALYGLRESDDTWSQMTLAWNNAPGNDVESGSEFNSTRTTLLDTFTILGLDGDGEPITLTGDADSPLVEFLQADTDGKVTFLIGRTDAGSRGQQATHRFASSDYTPPAGLPGQDAPQLTILPEPATISLLCLGAVALLRRSRKHA